MATINHWRQFLVTFFSGLLLPHSRANLVAKRQMPDPPEIESLFWDILLPTITSDHPSDRTRRCPFYVKRDGTGKSDKNFCRGACKTDSFLRY